MQTYRLFAIGKRAATGTLTVIVKYDMSISMFALDFFTFSLKFSVGISTTTKYEYIKEDNPKGAMIS